MIKLRNICPSRAKLMLLTALSALFGGATAHAQTSLFTFVSSTGSDGNSCFQPAVACASVGRAVTQTSEGGMVSCLSPPGNLGVGVTIERGITVACKFTSGVNTGGVLINAPGKLVRLQGIMPTGSPGGRSLIDITAASSVYLDNVVVSGKLGGPAIRDVRTGPGKLFIKDSVIEANDGPGIAVAPQGGTVIAAVLDNVVSRDNTYGLAVGIGGRIMATRSIFAFNSVSGIHSDTGGTIRLTDSLISNNSTGIYASPNSAISIANTGIQSNNTGVSGATLSFGNNRFIGNAASDGTPPTPAGSASTDFGQR